MSGTGKPSDPVSEISQTEGRPSAARIVGATLAALLVAIVILVTAVLPAEYGIDPLGTGRLLGLVQLAEVRPGVVTQQADEYRQDSREFVLGPFQFVEYKYRLDKGQALLYAWHATAAVNLEFHAEPDGAPKGYAETYEKRTGVEHASGTLMAPFAGIHGWYWENPTDHEVTVTLTSAGFYNLAHEFRKDTPTATKMFK